MWWRAFRRWPWWAQALVWVALCPVPLALLAVADPKRRRLWAGAAAATPPASVPAPAATPAPQPGAFEPVDDNPAAVEPLPETGTP